LVKTIISELKKSKNFFLMSDSGLPAFCDPGQTLVDACHLNSIQVTSTPFPNSIALAVALSGFSHQEFYFAGFLPVESGERKQKLVELSKLKCSMVLMDTPYRLQSLLKDLSDSPLKNRNLFLATQLNQPTEKCYRGPLQGKNSIKDQIGDLNKVEFVMVLSAQS
jgi:16S rRNA (cytidine1402-2'-O)-methyltransferase